nr:hypothetical protein BaRGS_001831 [Batillaria attramentaria]
MAENLWLQSVHDWYPNLHSKTYFLPPLHFNRVQYDVQTFPLVTRYPRSKTVMTSVNVWEQQIPLPLWPAVFVPTVPSGGNEV